MIIPYGRGNISTGNCLGRSWKTLPLTHRITPMPVINMKSITKLSLAALGGLGAWCALLKPRRGQPGWEKFQSARFAHRGLHNADAGIPENSMSAFRAAVERGFGAELDVHLMADGNLAVVHDSDLTRTSPCWAAESRSPFWSRCWPCSRTGLP